MTNELTDLQKDDLYAEYLSVRMTDLDKILLQSSFRDEVEAIENQDLLAAEVIFYNHGLTLLMSLATGFSPELLQDMFPAWRDEIEEYVQDS